MTASGRRHLLRPPRGAAEEAAYHAIRREALFAVYYPERIYDPHHPDERAPANHPHVLLLDDEVIGTVRIDWLDAERAALRLVAIRRDLQRRGHGRVLLELVEDVVRGAGGREIVLNANPEVLGFYLASGYGRGDWRDVIPGIAGSVRLGKRVH